MTRKRDPRGANRRGSDNADLGYATPDDAPPVHRWPTPRDMHGIAKAIRSRNETGRCVVCGEPTTTPGVTCKSERCLNAWIFGG
jgi:hypothetical protein